MMPYIKEIAVHHVHHLREISIKVEDTTSPKNGPTHLMLTGRNGSGKTSVLRAIWEVMTRMTENSVTADQRRKWIEDAKRRVDKAQDEHERNKEKDNLEKWEEHLAELVGTVELKSDDDGELARILHKREILIAYYDAQHSAKFAQPAAPRITEVGFSGDLRKKRSGTFLEFLLNLKVQGALFRDEGKNEEAARIGAWFEQFDKTLQHIFNDKQARLEFDPHGYVFTVAESSKRSPMTALADGYASLLDIVTDIILKMQTPDQLTAAYDKPGIVLIDEVETHLHLELQQLVMPILTSLFPKIQFIVTTHSPFVLSSVGNAVAFDLEKREPLDNADEYPYESLTEGYFGVQDTPTAITNKLRRVRELIRGGDLTAEQKEELGGLVRDLKGMQRNEELKLELAQISLRFL